LEEAKSLTQLLDAIAVEADLPMKQFYRAVGISKAQWYHLRHGTRPLTERTMTLLTGAIDAWVEDVLRPEDSRERLRSLQHQLVAQPTSRVRSGDVRQSIAEGNQSSAQVTARRTETSGEGVLRERQTAFGPLPPGIQWPYIIDRLDVLLVYERDRVVDRKTRQYWIRAAEDGLQHVQVTHQPFTQGDIRRCTLKPIANCRHTLTEALSKGAQRDVIELPRPLRLGEPFNYSYELVYEYTSRKPPEEMFQAEYFPNEGGQLTCGVQFAEDRPSAVWYFEEIAMMVAPGTPTAETLLKITKTGTSRRQFQCNRIRMGYGLAWRW
jgi:hypothetical protein